MNEFMVHLVSSVSLDILTQNTFSSFKNYFNEEINLKGDWRVALREIYPTGKINQVNKNYLKMFSSEGLKFSEKSVPFMMLSLDHKENELSFELVPMKTVTIF